MQVERQGDQPGNLHVFDRPDQDFRFDKHPSVRNRKRLSANELFVLSYAVIGEDYLQQAVICCSWA
jgi:hypothetical protein